MPPPRSGTLGPALRAVAPPSPASRSRRSVPRLRTRVAWPRPCPPRPPRPGAAPIRAARGWPRPPGKGPVTASLLRPQPEAPPIGQPGPRRPDRLRRSPRLAAPPLAASRLRPKEPERRPGPLPLAARPRLLPGALRVAPSPKLSLPPEREAPPPASRGGTYPGPRRRAPAPALPLQSRTGPRVARIAQPGGSAGGGGARGGEAWPGPGGLRAQVGLDGGSRRRGGFPHGGCLAGAAPERGRAADGVTACGFAAADLTVLGARNPSGARGGA